MNFPLRNALLLAVTVSVLAACGSSPSPTPPTPPSPAAIALETRVVELSMQPVERDFDGVVEAVGHATLAAQTGGRVVELAFDVGDEVNTGDVLARFTAVEQQSGQRRAQAALQAARANAAEAQAAFERTAALHPEGAISQSVYDQAKAAHDAAQAQLSSASAALREANAQAGYTEVRAPFPGIVSARHVESGETVAPGSSLFSLLSLNALRLAVDVPQSQAEIIANASSAFVQRDDGTRIAAAGITPFPEADKASHSLTLRLNLPKEASGLFRPGSSAKAVFVIGQAPRLAVPDSALMQRGEIAAVFVADGHGIPALRQVRNGRKFDGVTEILAGLRPGESIALDALAALEVRRSATVNR